MHHHTLTDNLQFPAESRINVAFFAIAIVGIILSAIGYIVEPQQFFFSYLTSFAFVANILLGCLFFVMLQHITSSKWSVVLRRIPETMSSQLYILPLLFIPILFGMEYLYEWVREEKIATDALVRHKLPYLNEPFFILRNILYFTVWAVLGFKLYSKSVEMDKDGDVVSLTKTLKKFSAPGVLLFGFTVAFASFDWLMSMDSHWFSTMFGVYFFAMSFQVFFAIVILIAIYLRSKNLLVNTIRIPHFNDLGKLLFGFTVFYAYIAFGQFFLIYYANIPEETLWFYFRLEGSWAFITYLLLFGRFVIPFVLLLGKRAKSNLKLLGSVSVMLVVLHFIEFYWIVQPILHKSGVSFHWLDLATLLALSGLVLGLFFNKLKTNNLVANKDPFIQESLNKH